MGAFVHIQKLRSQIPKLNITKSYSKITDKCNLGKIHEAAVKKCNSRSP